MVANLRRENGAGSEMNQSEEIRLVPLTDVCRNLGMDHMTAWRLITKGKVFGLQRGRSRRWFVDAQELVAAMEARKRRRIGAA